MGSSAANRAIMKLSTSPPTSTRDRQAAAWVEFVQSVVVLQLVER